MVTTTVDIFAYLQRAKSMALAANTKMAVEAPGVAAKRIQATAIQAM
jgi:hypothetical protein